MTTNANETAPADPFSQILPFNPYDPVFLDDPYPTFQRLRDESGPVIGAIPGMWLIIGHKEVSSLLRDNRFGHGDAALVASQITEDAEGNIVKPFIYMDPPDHTRVRSLVGKAFTARTVEAMRPRARELVRELIETALAKNDGPVDLMAELAFPLPSVLIGELLGVPSQDLERFRSWSKALGRGLDPDFLLTPEEIQTRDDARSEFDAYFADLAERRRAEPAGDLVSALVAVEDGGDRLSRSELVAACRLVLSAGNVSTAHLIGNGTLALLRHPDQLAWLRANPGKVKQAVEEMLRYDPPVQLTGTRVALEDGEAGDHPIKAGEAVVLFVGAANRDPATFPDPDRFDLTRESGGRNLGFGMGIHFCLGASLARLTTQETIDELIRLDLRLADDNPSHAANLILRGLNELPVHMSRAETPA
ncbi:MAG: cytochrome P450 [Actinoallomurus sp.]